MTDPAEIEALADEMGFAFAKAFHEDNPRALDEINGWADFGGDTKERVVNAMASAINNTSLRALMAENGRLYTLAKANNDLAKMRSTELTQARADLAAAVEALRRIDATATAEQAWAKSIGTHYGHNGRAEIIQICRSVLFKHKVAA